MNLSASEYDYIDWRLGSKYLCLDCGNRVLLFRGRPGWDQVFAAKFPEIVLTEVVNEFLALNIGRVN